MNTYYLRDGSVIGRAYGLMFCDNMENHKAHVHDPQHSLYGPYLCAGLPTRWIYDQPARKPIN